MSYKRISKSILLIPWEKWQKPSLMKTLSRELDMFLIADLASNETGWGDAGFSAQAQQSQKLGSAFKTLRKAKMVWDHQNDSPKMDQCSCSPSKDAKSHHELGPHRTWPSSLELKTKSFWWAKWTEGQKDPNPTCHPAPIPGIPISYLLSILLGTAVDRKRIQCAQLRHWPQKQKVTFPTEQ